MGEGFLFHDLERVSELRFLVGRRAFSSDPKYYSKLLNFEVVYNYLYWQ